MSSKEDDIDDESSFIVRPHTWRSEEYPNCLCALEVEQKTTRSQQGKREVNKRKLGHHQHALYLEMLSTTITGSFEEKTTLQNANRNTYIDGYTVPQSKVYLFCCFKQRTSDRKIY